MPQAKQTPRGCKGEGLSWGSSERGLFRKMEIRPDYSRKKEVDHPDLSSIGAPLCQFMSEATRYQ